MENFLRSSQKNLYFMVWFLPKRLLHLSFSDEKKNVSMLVLT